MLDEHLVHLVRLDVHVLQVDVSPENRHAKLILVELEQVVVEDLLKLMQDFLFKHFCYEKVV